MKSRLRLAISAFATFCICSSLSFAASFEKTQLAAPKVDLLFVVDNSGTMGPSMISLLHHLPALIDTLKVRFVDFHIGVTTTDAYLYAYGPNYKDHAKLRDGVGQTKSGVFVITRDTPDIEKVLATNLAQGTGGSGDERAFASFRETLNLAANSGFRRADASLSVVVVSDEDDFSHNDLSDDPQNPGKNYYFTEDYNDPKMIKIDEFKQYLDKVGGKQMATFSTISVQDKECQNKLTGAKIGHRYNMLVQASDGVFGNICDMGNSLRLYADHVVRLAAPVPDKEYVIKLDRPPMLETVVVKVNGRLIPSHPTDGWTYDDKTLSLVLRGKALPKKGDIVSVTFDYEEAL